MRMLPLQRSTAVARVRQRMSVWESVRMCVYLSEGEREYLFLQCSTRDDVVSYVYVLLLSHRVTMEKIQLVCLSYTQFSLASM